MFIKEMSDVIEDTQKILDTCCSKNNVSMAVTENLLCLKELFGRIDPDKTDLTHITIFNKQKVKKYWETFDAANAELNALYAKLERNRKVKSNTSVTLDSQHSRFLTSYNAFCEIAEKNSDDVDLANQLIVTNSIKNMLENTITEYQALAKTIDSILNILKQSLKTASILVKQKQSVSKQDLETFRKELRLLAQ